MRPQGGLMKKVGALFVTLALFTSVSFAENAGERSIHVAGLDVPITGITLLSEQKLNGVKYDEYDKFSGLGIELMYHRLKISDNGFSSFFNCELGYGNYKWKEIEAKVNGAKIATASLSDKDGYDALVPRFSFGIGYAPLNTDMFILALHGTLGVNGVVGSRSQSGFENGTIVTKDNWAACLWTTLGANVDFVIKLSEHVGIFSGINMYTNLIGLAFFGSDVKSTGTNISSTSSTSSTGLVYPGHFNIDLRVGVAFVY